MQILLWQQSYYDHQKEKSKPSQSGEKKNKSFFFQTIHIQHNRFAQNQKSGDGSRNNKQEQHKHWGQKVVGLATVENFLDMRKKPGDSGNVN